MNKIEKIASPMAEMYFSDGILFAEIIPGNDLTLEEAEEHQQLKDQHFSQYYPLLILMDMGTVKQMSKVARDYFVKEETAEKNKASAVLISSGAGRIAGNLFLQFFRPKFPMKMFNDRSKALEWLREQK